MKIAIDFDGTLANTMERWRETSIKFHGAREYSPIAPKGWDIDVHMGIHSSKLDDIFNETRENMTWVAPVDSSFYVWVQKLIDAGHECYVLTKNPEWTVPIIKRWLGKYNLELPIHIVNTMEAKLEWDWDVCIDDAPHLAIAHTNASDPRPLLVYHQSWNSELALESMTQKRVYNWESIHRCFSEWNGFIHGRRAKELFGEHLDAGHIYDSGWLDTSVDTSGDTGDDTSGDTGDDSNVSDTIGDTGDDSNVSDQRSQQGRE